MNVPRLVPTLVSTAFFALAAPTVAGARAAQPATSEAPAPDDRPGASPDDEAAPAPAAPVGDEPAAPRSPGESAVPISEEPTAPAADPVPAAEVSAAAPAPGSLSLTVVDAQAGAAFDGVLVLIDGELAATTDVGGRAFVGQVAPGRHLVTLAGPRGEELSLEIEVASGGAVARSLRLGANAVESVELVQKVARPKREAGEVNLSQKDVTAVPGTLGDPVRVIENLPGASRAPGGMGGALIIRGANPADSVVLLDGVQIPILYHFGGLTSVVNSEFLSAVSFLPGGFGAQHGRSTGGVAEIQSTTLNCEQLRASAAVDLLDAELFGCAPLGRWKVAAAARRSYIDAFLPTLLRNTAEEGKNPTIVTPSYFDYQLKAETTLNGRHRFEIFAFGSHDRLSVVRATSTEDSDLDIGGTLAFHRLQARHFYLRDAFTLESSLTPGFLRRNFREGSQDLGQQEHGGVDMYTVQWRQTASFALAPQLTLRAGLDHLFTYWQSDFLTTLPNLGRRYPTPLEVDARDRNTWQHDASGLDQAYFAELVWRPTQALTLTPGLRLAHLVFDTTKRFVAEPRLAARWQASLDTAFTAAGGVYRKLPDPMSGVMVEGFGQPNLRAERALQVSSGVEHKVGRWQGKLEAFYVRRDQLPSPTSEIEVVDGRPVPVLFRSDGRGRSYGLEAMLRLPADEGDRFSGWVAYTLSRSYRRDRVALASGGEEFAPADPGTPRLADGLTEREYLSPFDQTHIMTAVGRWELPWKMSLGFRFQFVTGNPSTPLERGESYYDADKDRYQVRPGSVAAGSSRLPTFHRLDLRLDKRWDFASWKLTAYLEVMNAYNQQPVESFSYDYRYKTRRELHGLPILPLLGIKGEI